MGPKDQPRLASIAEGLDLTVDYGFLWFIAQPLFSGLTWIFDWVGNWGVAIILLTVFVKILLYPTVCGWLQIHGSNEKNYNQK